jgi:DNA modification methylase
VSFLVLNADANRIPLADGSVHCVVTSPPYWGLRDYGYESQIGNEKTPEEYVQRLTLAFREVARVLRHDGTLWLNIGDVWANTGGHTSLGRNSVRQGRSSIPAQYARKGMIPPGWKRKDMIGVSWMLVNSLRTDGWFHRSEIIWSKTNSTPDSVSDRPQMSHERIFVLSKSMKYYYDRYFSKILDGDDPRSVWTMPVGRYSGSHFATMPPKLVFRCISYGSSAGGCCSLCGSPMIRRVRKTRSPNRPIHIDHLGWDRPCSCESRPPVPCRVLDPFGGSGTTSIVAESVGRDSILCELARPYAEMAHSRILA